MLNLPSYIIPRAGEGYNQGSSFLTYSILSLRAHILVILLGVLPAAAMGQLLKLTSLNMYGTGLSGT